MNNATYIVGALLALTAPVAAQAFSDNFDSYTNGTVLNGVGGWKGWDNNVAVAGVVTNSRRLSLPNSMLCDGTAMTDAIHPVTGATSGRWLLTVKQRIQLGDLAGGNVYVIGNNQYNDGGPYLWTIQVSASNTTTTVVDDIRGGSLPLIYNRWVEYCFDIDLDNNAMTIYYDGQVLSTGLYKLATNTGPLEFANLDLYSSGGTCNFDDVSFRQAFSTYGTGLAGSGAFVPTIKGTGCPNLGRQLSFEIGAGLGGAQGVMLFGSAPISFPFFGGTLLVLPDFFSVQYTLAGAGAGNGTKTVSVGIPVDTNLINLGVHAQGLTLDPGAVQGISFTNGAKAIIGG